MSVLKLSLDQQKKTLGLADWFTPFNAENLNQNDTDLCTGPVLLPWRNLVGAWGKDRAYYILDRNKMGHFTPGANAIAQFAPDMTSPQPQNVNRPGGGTGTFMELRSFSSTPRWARFPMFGLKRRLERLSIRQTKKASSKLTRCLT